MTLITFSTFFTTLPWLTCRSSCSLLSINQVEQIICIFWISRARMIKLLFLDRKVSHMNSKCSKTSQMRTYMIFCNAFPTMKQCLSILMKIQSCEAHLSWIIGPIKLKFLTLIWIWIIYPRKAYHNRFLRMNLLPMV